METRHFLPLWELQEWMHVSFFCPVAVCVRGATAPDTVRDKGTHSPSPLSLILCLLWFLLHIRQTASLRPSETRPGLAPYTLSAVWHTHACAIARGLITWHTYMTSSACNQIHMSPFPFPLLLLYLYLSLEFFHSFLSTHDFVSTFLFLLVFLLSLLLSFSLSLSAFVHHLCFFSCFWSQPGPQHELRC